MTLTIRRILYLSFAAVFIAVAPVLVLYASGYRFNFYKKKIEKTGSLFISTTPPTVNIKINNTFLTDQTTPLKLNYLMPNDYYVTISKKGFTSWQKKLTVYPGKITFAEHIYLFKSKPNFQKIAPKNTDFWTYNPRLDFILWQEENGEFYLYNLLTKNKKNIFQQPTKIKQSRWSDDYTKLMLLTDKYLLIWDTALPTQINKISLPAIFTNCRWDQDDDNTIYCQEENKIWLTTTDKPKFNLIQNFTAEEILDFYKQNNNLYLIIYTPATHTTYLKIIPPASPSSKNWPDFILPSSAGYKFISINGNTVTIRDTKLKNIYQLNLSRQESSFNSASQIIQNAIDGKYNKDGQFAYFNNWEVWLLQQNQGKLITRQTDKIIDIFWYTSDNYLVIIEEDGAKIIELDDRDKRNYAQFNSPSPIKKAALSKNGKYIIWQFGTGEIFTVQILPTDLDVPLPTLKP